MSPDTSNAITVADRMVALQAVADGIRQPGGCGNAICQTRTQAVPGSGNPQPEIVFIGEGPGQKEDQTGEPFVGAAGTFLAEMLASIGLERSDVFITNIVKCRPPDNRDPMPEEKTTCTPFLDEQLAILEPRLIVLLGRHAMEYFLPGLKISQVHGQPNKKGGRVYLPLYHPAAALYNGSQREVLLADFQTIPAILAALQD